MIKLENDLMKNFKATLHWENFDKDGKLISKTEPVECDSWVKNMINLLYVQVNNIAVGTPYAMTDTGNTSRNIYATQYTFTQANGQATEGIRVGTSSTAVTIDDIAAGTLIADGAGAGQLTYGSTSVSVPVTVGSTRQFTLARTFTNNSGGDITVQEVVLYLDALDTGAAHRVYCVDRTLLPNQILNTASATATYTISTTVT